MLQQMALFDIGPYERTVHRRIRRITRKQDEGSKKRLPVQKKLVLKWARKIAFKRRFKEDPNATNDYSWSLEAIHRLHLELFRDWEDRFPVVEDRESVLDYWAWMLGNPEEAFSFRDVLVTAGYRQPYEFIGQLPGLAPDWVLEKLGIEAPTNTTA